MNNSIFAKITVFALFFVVVTAFAAAAKAEIMWGQRPNMTSYAITQWDTTLNPPGAPVFQQTLTHEPFRGGPVGSGVNDMTFFVLNLWDCPAGVDSWQAFLDLQNPSKGVDFNRTSSLADSVLRTDQKQAIQTLVNHVYKPMQDAWDQYVIAWDAWSGWQEAFDVYDIYSLTLQYAIFEIVTEESGVWNTQNGTSYFEVTDVYPGSKSSYTAAQANAEFHALIDGWFVGLSTGVWDSRFADELNYDVTVYAGDNYKSFFSVTEGTPPVTPEPASLLMVGLGLAGVPFLRRKR